MLMQPSRRELQHRWVKRKERIERAPATSRVKRHHDVKAAALGSKHPEIV